MAADRFGKGVSWYPAFCEKVGYLSIGMHTRVGSPGSVNYDIFAGEFSNAFLDALLNGRNHWLFLPATVIRTVIFNDKFDIAWHSLLLDSREKHRGHWNDIGLLRKKILFASFAIDFQLAGILDLDFQLDPALNFTPLTRKPVFCSHLYLLSDSDELFSFSLKPLSKATEIFFACNLSKPAIANFFLTH
jgi:hypothetical protein